VIGRVRSVAGDSITLDTPQGLWLVTVNEETEVKRAEGEASWSSFCHPRPRDDTPMAVGSVPLARVTLRNLDTGEVGRASP
jgi:hypothetical protein